MTIEKKFNMFSTKEWIQYLQYKLSPEREKEIEEHASSDPFLKEALEAISTQENRPIAFQSISFLISMIEENTGVSESKIARAPGRRTSATTNNSKMDPKIILLAIGGLILAAAIGFGIYYFMNSSSATSESEENTALIDSASMINSNYADSSNRPFDVIPNTTTTPVDTTPTAITNPQSSASRSVKKTQTSSTSDVISPSYTKPNESSGNSSTSTSIGSNKERELFNQAQDLYVNKKPEEAKKILNELKSYDNPMKDKAEKILNQMGN